MPLLTAQIEGRNARHARIGVFQSGGKAGVLTVDANEEAAVIRAINSHDDLLAACKAMFALLDEEYENAISNGYFPSVASLCLEATAAIAKAEGTP